MCLPRALEVRRINVAARSYADQDAALADPFVVTFDTLLGHVPANEGTDNTAGRGASASTSDRRCERTGDHQAESRQRDGRAYGRHRRSDGANRAANCAADASTLSCFVAKFGLGARQREVAFPCFIGHCDIDIVLGVTPFRQGVVAQFGAFPVREQAGHQRFFIAHVSSPSAGGWNRRLGTGRVLYGAVAWSSFS